jgi:hypothetical protein
MTQLFPSGETSAADWIVAALDTFAQSVVSLVPRGFPNYVRIFHPAYMFDRQSAQPWARAPVRWADVAAANRTRVHSGMQWLGLTGGYQFLRRPRPGVYDISPAEGTLPLEVADSLVAVLGTHTAANRCWFAIWNGFGSTRDDIRRAATFLVPGREYFLLSGPTTAVTETALTDGGYQSPNIWWPDDHAWCVATEIDLNTTYIGCSEACRDDLLRNGDLEAIEIAPATGVSLASDIVNPSPSRPHEPRPPLG